MASKKEATGGRASSAHSDLEHSKLDVGHLEVVPDPDDGLSEEEKAKIDRRLLWKLDMRLIPWLSLLYLASFLDRTNIGNAKIDGLQEALNMSDGQYNASLTIFFISYSIFEPLTNVLLKRTLPSIFIPTIIVLWGICMTTMGLVHNFSGLMAARWFLGLAEAGLFPGISYYLSCWYKRSEFGIRMAIFFSSAALAGSFGGLLAAAIAKMNGVGGKDGWAWIFILEGLATIIIGVISFWLVYDFPDKAKFLSDVDRKRVMRRLALDQQSSSANIEWKSSYMWDSLKDHKTWLGAIMYMGYSSTRAQLLSVPPYACAAVVTISVGYIADRTRQRGLCNIFASIFGIIGFCMLLGTKSPGVKYAGVFLGAIGIYPCIANTIAWVSNNVEGIYKRGLTIGIMIGWGNLNGIMSSNIYRKADAPDYYPGHGTVLAYLTLFLFLGSVVQHLLLRRENRKRQRGDRDHRIEGLTPQEIEDLGDKKPDFIYTI
ncbi:major facilitator superfamily domain-containing protein [Aspergillus bertholletiae]|uniref:Major facilitator superfamily domain-containing protein n=1 Tax=Aspergillus bertholletiae TaxID=1226010 RepID=A0A5N7BDJ9_9EURO|nr:major facilitator superfamily domain-containing protein [Aspergillus bertholletiae]